MQKEFLIETRSVTDEKGTLLNLKYYLIEEKRLRLSLFTVSASKNRLRSVRASKKQESTPPVSDSETHARQMLCQLIKNAVTPVCLLEIVDDMMTKEEGQAF